jgi:DNA repair photolyase
LIRRDVDVLQALARETMIGVYFSIPFADYDIARALEPFAPSPIARFEAMKILADAGIQVGIGIAPTIPGLSTDIPGLLQRAKDCGATKAFINMLRLPGSVAPYFEKRLREKLPTKADRVLNRIRDARGGKLNSSTFHERMHGKGQYWSAQEKLFEVYCKKLGFNEQRVGTENARKMPTFRRPGAQALLFE